MGKDTHTELQEVLASRIRSGTATDEDKTELFQSVRSFCASVANRYTAALRFSDETEDLLQESYAPVMDAAASYDPDSGASFTTWLSFYLHSAFNAYIGRQFGRSRGTVERRSRVIRYERNFTASNGRAPSDEEILKHFRMKPETLHFLRSAGTCESLDEEVAEDITRADQVDSGEDLEDTICDRMVMDQVRQLLRQYVDELSQEERIAINLYFFQNMSYSKAGARIGKTGDSFRALQQRALRHIATKQHMKELGRYMPELAGSRAYRGTGSEFESSTERAAIWMITHDPENKHMEDNTHEKN